MRSTPAVALTMNATTPTGGKTSPIATIIIEITPNQIGSKPSEVINGKVSCSVSRRRGIFIHEHADDEIGHHDADDDHPAIEVHGGDGGDRLLGNAAQRHV